MFCNNLCSRFSKNIVSHYRQERLSRQSSYAGKSIFPPDFSFLFIIFLSFEPERIQCWLPTVPFEDKRTTQRVPHAKPTRWRFELNAFAFACPRKRKRV